MVPGHLIVWDGRYLFFLSADQKVVTRLVF